MQHQYLCYYYLSSALPLPVTPDSPADWWGVYPCAFHSWMDDGPLQDIHLPTRVCILLDGCSCGSWVGMSRSCAKLGCHTRTSNNSSNCCNVCGGWTGILLVPQACHRLGAECRRLPVVFLAVVPHRVLRHVRSRDLRRVCCLLVVRARGTRSHMQGLLGLLGLPHTLGCLLLLRQ